MEGKGKSGPRGNQNSWGCDIQNGNVAPAGTTSEPSVQKSAVQGTVKILGRTFKLPGLW